MHKEEVEFVSLTIAGIQERHGMLQVRGWKELHFRHVDDPQECSHL